MEGRDSEDSRSGFHGNFEQKKIIYMWLHWVVVAVWTSSSCGQWGLFFTVVCGLLTAVASLIAGHGLYGTWAQQLQLVGSRAWVKQLWPMGLAACSMWDSSSQTKDGTHVPCIGRWILNHWTTREVPEIFIFFKLCTDPKGLTELRLT